MSKKHRKFLATSVTAAIVASAIAPIGAAAATGFSDLKEGDFGYSEVMDLVELDLIKGYPDGTFKPNAEINRSQVAVLLARAWDLELPSDADTAAILKENYTDVTADTLYAKEIAAVTEAGLMQGNTVAKTFSPKATLKREQMATVLVRAYGLENTGEKTNLTDLAAVSADHRENVETLTQHGIANNEDGTFDPKNPTKRVHFAVYMHRAEVGAPIEDPTVKSVSAIAAKKLEVEFSQAVDTEKATFEIKKGTSVINVAAVTFNEDKTKAVLEFSTKLTAGDYTVNVKGLSDEVLTEKVSVAAETVTNIELLATEAPIKTGTATVGYKVSNQYGEDITSDVIISSPDANVVVNKVDKTIAVSNLDLNSSTSIPDSRTFTLIHSSTGLAKTVTVKATAAAVVSDVQIAGVYNIDGKALVEGTDLGASSDVYYLEVVAKDQYGNVLKASELNSGLYLTESNSSVVNVTDVTNAPTIVEFTTKDGVKKTGIKLVGTTAAGSNLVTLVASATGAYANHNIAVQEAAKIDVISMSVPELVVANEDLVIPVSVTDTKGNAVTDASKVTNVTAKLGSAVGTFENDKDGKLVLKFAKATVVEGKTTLLVVSPTGKAASQLVDVQEAAKPVLIQGLKSDVSTAIYVDKTYTTADFLVKDQYGRTVDALPAGFAVAVKSEAIASSDTNNVLTFTGLTVAAVKKGTEQVTFQLTNGGTPVVNSEKAVNFTVVEKSDFVSYGIEAIPTVYANSDSAATLDAYDQEVVVYGLTAGGLKVNLRNSDYNVTSNASELQVEAHATKWVVDGVDTAELANNTSKTAKLTVTLNSTGEELTKDVAVSNVAPTVEKVEYKVSNKVATTLEFDNASNSDFNADDVYANVYTTDSYGKEAVLAANSDVTRITFSNIKDKSTTNAITIAANGTGSATLGTLEDGDTFDATIYVGGKSMKLAVTVK